MGSFLRSDLLVILDLIIDFAFIQYSMYGHIQQLAQAEKAGIEAAGGSADLYQ